MGDTPSVHAEDRVQAPIEPAQECLREAFFQNIDRLTLGLVAGRRWRLQLGPVTLLAFGEPALDGRSWSWPITGGVLAARPGGKLTYGWREGELIGAVDGYLPRLPRLLYWALQAPLHRLVTRRFLIQLRGRTPPPGVPAGPAQRLLTAGLDLVLCAALTGLLRPRRPLLVAAAVTAVYHVGCWSYGGRTPGALLTGQRLVSVDGGRVALWQALIRLAALPVAAWERRAVHDEAASTEVIEESYLPHPGSTARLP